MTTVVEALMQAAQDLRDAVASVLGLRADVQALKDSTTSSAQTIIQNFVNRAPVVSLFIDENNGIDGPGHGGSLDNPFKTLDYALDNSDASVIRFFSLLSDVTVRKQRPTFGPITIAGIVKANNGIGYTDARRKISFLAEATNSPSLSLGRVTPFFDHYGPSFTFYSVEIALPNVSADIAWPYFMATHGGNYSIGNCAITTLVAGSKAILFIPQAGRATYSIVGTSIDTNSQGKIFAGVAAGADPRTNYLYETNLQTA